MQLKNNPNSKISYHDLEYKSGSHTIDIVYSGDEHHKAMNKTFKYHITFYTCEIKDNILYVTIASSKSGILKVNVNNINIKNITITKHKAYYRQGSEYIAGDEYVIPLDYLKKDENHIVEVSFKGDDDSFNEIFNFTLTCPSEFYDYPSEYFLEIDSDIMIPFLAPNDLENKVNITVNNKSYNYFKVEDYSSKFILYNVNVSDLKPGNYNMNISYSGDSKYSSNSIIQNFNITTSIFRLWENYNDKISLRLPADAKGNLTLDYDGYYESVALKEGKAIIVLLHLNGEGKYNAYYTGDDYEVPEYESYTYYDFDIIYDFAS